MAGDTAVFQKQRERRMLMLCWLNPLFPQSVFSAPRMIVVVLRFVLQMMPPIFGVGTSV